LSDILKHSVLNLYTVISYADISTVMLQGVISNNFNLPHIQLLGKLTYNSKICFTYLYHFNFLLSIHKKLELCYSPCFFILI